jgi:plastocyanin
MKEGTAMATRLERVTGTMGSRVGRRGVLGGALGASALALAACGGGAGAAQAAGGAARPDWTLYVFRGETGVKGPDGKGHDAFVPSGIVVKAGVPATVQVTNYDEGPHSITAEGLGLDQLIQGGKEVGDTVQPVTTTFSFTAAKAGVYRWYCKLPCDAGNGAWAMTDGYDGPKQDGFMAGHIVVL